MPYSAKQASRILANGTLPKDHTLTTSQAVCEADLRLRLLRWENRAVKRMDAVFKRAWKNIHYSGMASAEDLNINGNLSTVNGGLKWRDATYEVITEVVGGLGREVGAIGWWMSITAYRLGYVGKAWGLTASRKPELPRIPLNISPFAENQLRDEWELRYGNLWGLTIWQLFREFEQKARSALNTAVTNQETPAQGMKRVKALMGLPKYDKLYFAAQSHIRTLIQLGASLGELQLYTEFGASQPVREAVAGMDAVMGILTQGDGKVCPRCIDASRRLWPVNSITQIIGAALTFPIPPIHFNCRCSVFLFVLPDQLLPDDMLPGLTFGEYLAYEALTGLLDVFDAKEVQPQII